MIVIRCWKKNVAKTIARDILTWVAEKQLVENPDSNDICYKNQVYGPGLKSGQQEI